MDEITRYNITHELIGDSAPATAEEIEGIVAGWELEGWSFEVRERGNELRVYAIRAEDSDVNHNITTAMHTHWRETGYDDEFYIIVGETLSDE